MKDRIRPPKDLEFILDKLKDDKVFETKQKGMMFAAAIGYHFHLDKFATSEIESFGEGIRLEYFDSAGDVGFIDALAVAVSKSLNILSDDNQPFRVELFQKLAYFGLKDLKKYCYDEKPDYPLFGILKILDILDKPEIDILPGLENLF